MEEFELVRRCLRGEEGAWERLVREHAPRLRSVLTRSSVRLGATPSEDRLDDWIADLFLRLCARDGELLRRLSPGVPLAAWLNILALSVLRDDLKRERRRRFRLEEYRRLSAEVGSAEPSGAGGTGRVESALDSLEPRDRLLLQWAYVERLTHANISFLTGLSETSIGSALTRAKRRFEEAFRKFQGL